MANSCVRTSTPMHGMYFHHGDDLDWWQYWIGVEHVWRWHGIVVWWALRKRDRPMHELIKRATGG